MCIAIYKPYDKDLIYDQLKIIHKSNPDGCGFMTWVEHGINGLVVMVKGLMDFDKFWNVYSKTISNINHDFVLHFRTASASNISREDCHPFYVNENKTLAFVKHLLLFIMAISLSCRIILQVEIRKKILILRDLITKY